MFFRLTVIIVLLSLSAPFAGSKEAIKELADSIQSALPASISQCTVAVFPFVSSGQAEGTAISEMLVRELSSRPRFMLIDRDAFRKAMAEIALSQTGVFDESATLSAGKIMSARYLLTGSLTDAFGLKRINAKITRTETSETVAAAASVLSGSELSNLPKELLSEKASITGALFRSLLFPGWGQIYTDHPVRGALSMALCMSGLGFTIATAVSSSNDYTDYNARINYETSENYADDLRNNRITPELLKSQQDDLYKTYSDKQDRLKLLIAATAGLWTLNLLDATLAGNQAKKRYTTYFTLIENRPAIIISVNLL